MRVRDHLLVITALAASLAVDVTAWGEQRTDLGSAQAIAADRPWEVIEVAIALDTSTSMDLLIETARVRLWEIVRDLTLVEPTPTLRVALVTFGNFANERAAGWVRVETDFTRDLDLVSDRLFELTSDGGTEYLGRVVKTAVGGLSWTPSDEALKILFVAGNESATQDPRVTLAEMSNVALEAGITLHVIYCGDEQHEDAESWKRLAEVAVGEFAVIDHRLSPVVVETPFDSELSELGSAMNRTYVPLGEEGQQRYRMLAEQDKRVFELSPAAAASRAEVKSSRIYSSSWDLVDAVESGEQDIYALDESQLPEAVQEMSPGERDAYVQELQASRRELRERIALLSEQRRRYVAEALKARAIDTSRAFDTVVRQAIREKLEERGFQAPRG